MYSIPVTFTQALFLCCLFVFGPAFGIIAVYRHIDSRLGGLWSFLTACFFAYSGWFLSGIVAKLLHPDYGSEYGISELGAALYTIPGFITGWVGLIVLSKISNKNPNNIK
jgi:hypothetical protein